MNIPSIKGMIASATKGSFSGILDGAANIISKFKADPTKAAEAEAALAELRINAELEAERLANDLAAIHQKEMESSRNREIQIATSGASWITRNTTAILALSFVGVTLALYTLSLMGWAQIDREILQDLRDVVILIMGYYFGSSLGSKKKQEQIDRMTKD